MAGPHHGHKGAIKVGANVVAHVQEWTYREEDVNVLEYVSMRGTTAGNIASGAKRGSGSFSCLLDESDTNGQNALAVGASVSGTFETDSATGSRKFSGTIIIEDREVTDAKDGIVTLTGTFKNVLTAGTV